MLQIEPPCLGKRNDLTAKFIFPNQLVTIRIAFWAGILGRIQKAEYINILKATRPTNLELFSYLSIWIDSKPIVWV